MEGESGKIADTEFGQSIQWNLSLLEGYPHRFFPNKGYGRSKGSRGYGAYDNPGMLEALKNRPRSIVVVHGWSYKTYVDILKQAKAMGHTLLFRGETNLSMEMARPWYLRMPRKIWLRRLLEHCHYFGYIGSESQAFYRYLGFDDRRMLPMPYAVDNARFRGKAMAASRGEARKQMGWPDGQYIFLFAGKFIPKKRPMDILRAFASPGLENACLVMVGDGPLRGEMEAFIVKNGLGKRVILPGFVNQQQIPLAYRAADALVLASDYGETWGLVVNEAMNAALPLLLSDRVGCRPDLLQEGVNGFGFPCGNPHDMAKAMQQFMALSAEQREQMGRHSLERVEYFSFDTILASLKAIT